MTEHLWYETVSLPALLRHARRTYGEAMRAALEREGYDDIPANGLYVIGALALNRDGVSIGEIVKDLNISKQATGQLVDTLVARGYLGRSPDDNDRRQVIVTLTKRGLGAARAQAKGREQIDHALLAAVGEPDMASARRVLGTLIEMRKSSAAGATPDH